MHLSVVILAAGQGKRMNSDLPKVLQPLAGQPLLQHVIDTARDLRPANIYVVYGHGGAQVQAALAHEHIEWLAVRDLREPDEKRLALGEGVRELRAAALAKLSAPAGEPSRPVGDDRLRPASR